MADSDVYVDAYIKLIAIRKGNINIYAPCVDWSHCYYFLLFFMELCIAKIPLIVLLYTYIII